MNPTRYRPNIQQGDEDWEDNRVSNAAAWLSDSMLGKEFCGNPENLPVQVVNYLWADCACCLFYRGVLLGASVTSAIAVVAVTLT